jgi:hypothetical protein
MVVQKIKYNVKMTLNLLLTIKLQVMRGVVDASWEENNFGSIPAGSVNEILKVRVKLIDLGTIVDMELDDLYYYHQNDCNYGNASLFHL